MMAPLLRRNRLAGCAKNWQFLHPAVAAGIIILAERCVSTAVQDERLQSTVTAKTGLLLDHFVRLAANDAATPAAVVAVLGRARDRAQRRASLGLSREQLVVVDAVDRILATSVDPTTVPDMALDDRFAALIPTSDQPWLRFLYHANLYASGGDRVGFICLLDEHPRPGLTEAQSASIAHIADMVIADRRREQRHLHLMHVADRALRVDRLLRVVSDATSCADALTELLEELSVFHGAAVGRIWQLLRPTEPLMEVSRYQQVGRVAADLDPLVAVAGVTAEAIRRNTPYAIGAAEPDSEGVPGIETPGLSSGYVCIPIWVQQQRFGVSLMFTGEDVDLDMVVADITSLADTIRPALLRKVTEERIRFAAHHDDLTQLANRLMFQDRLRSALVSARAAGRGFALLYLDLDGFKLVNDTRGHEAGDRLLVTVAERLRDSVRDSDTVARIGGDEFAIIQQFGDDPVAASSLAERLQEKISQPFDIIGGPQRVGVSIGIALYPQHGETPDALLRNADIALYRAKKGGRNTFRFFDSQMQAVQQERLLVEQDLRDAINEQNFTLAYQPVCESDSLGIVGFEALLRWNSATRGPIQPEQFISLAKVSGLIVPLGRWALEAACADAATWDPSVSLSVNLSPLQFRQHDLAVQVADVLCRTGLAPERLELEVTEGLLLEDSELVLRTMRGFQEQGIRITLDDFGTAYASLSYLRRFPFDGIKIDRSFVHGLGDDSSSLEIVGAMLSLGERLNIAVVAEGVETQRELQILRNLGCRLVQGYFSGRPSDGKQARILLRDSVSRSKMTTHPAG
jgi:diguanylate cyclase (GGDEF)-like protein